MAYFQTQNPNLGKFWSISQYKMFIYFMVVWFIMQQLYIFCGFYGHFEYFSHFGMLSREKSGNPGCYSGLLKTAHFQNAASLLLRKKSFDEISCIASKCFYLCSCGETKIGAKKSDFNLHSQRA
jgi:hypothetical protein